MGLYRPPAQDPQGAPGPEGDEEVAEWPRIDPGAFQGLLGEFVGAVAPHTEGDPVGVLVQVLAGFGNLLGRDPHYVVGATPHRGNLFVALVGVTGHARKGTAWDVARQLLQLTDPPWARQSIRGGLVSGEGLVHSVRDPRWGVETRGRKGAVTRPVVLLDEGVQDKRLLIVETEFAKTLQGMARPASTLSAVLRQAWDGSDLCTLGKVTPETATGAHISVIAHTTLTDIRRHLTRTETGNGFANRFLWVGVRRSQVLARGGDLAGVDWESFHGRFSAAATHARTLGVVPRDEDAEALWVHEYPRLSAGAPGTLGALLGRAESQVGRLALLYALCDSSPVIRLPHLRAAFALWRYCVESAHFFFGDDPGDQATTMVLRALRASPGGLTRSQLLRMFKNSQNTTALMRVLADLSAQGVIHRTRDRAAVGRPSERWHHGAPPEVSQGT
jgi:hypothetical protein